MGGKRVGCRRRRTGRPRRPLEDGGKVAVEDEDGEGEEVQPGHVGARAKLEKRGATSSRRRVEGGGEGAVEDEGEELRLLDVEARADWGQRGGAPWTSTKRLLR